MIVDQLFNNKKNINESLADEFMTMARAKGYNPRLAGTPDQERARTDAMMKQRAVDRANAPKPQPVDAETRAHLQDQLKSLEAKFDPNYEYSDDHSFWKEQSSIAQQINRIKSELSRGISESRQRQLSEAMLLEDPVYRKFKVIGRYIAERKLTEPEILQVFADAEAGMTDKATGANRTMLGRGKDTTMDFAGGVADALKGVWDGIQRNSTVAGVDVAYDKATDAIGKLVGGEKGAVMSAIKRYRMLAKQYPKTAGLAKAALTAITGLATGGAGLPAAAALIYGLDSAIKGEKFSDIALKASGAAATAWAAGKIGGMFGGDQAAAPDGSAGSIEAADQVYQGAETVSAAGAETAAGASKFDDIVANAIDYKIKDGDTLTQILADKKINPEAFKRLPGNEVYFSPDGNPDVIKAGQTIKLPRPEDVGALNRMSWTTPDAGSDNLQRWLDDPDGYTGLYNPNNNRFSLDAATNLKQQELGRYASSDIAANRVAQDAARASGGPELLGGPGAGDVASPVADVAASAAVPAPSPLTLQPPATPGGPQFGTVTLPDGQTLKAAAFPEGGITPRLPVGSTPVTINYNGQELTGRIVNDTVYFTKFPADAAAGTTGGAASGAGTLSGMTAQQIFNSPVYQQIYAQEIARYGAEPSARAIQAAQQIATMKAKAAMAGVVRENNILRTAKLRRLPVSELFDQKLTTLAWALNESVGKPQGNSVHLTGRGVNVVFENIQRIAEAVADVEELSPEEIARNERIQKMYQLTRGQGLSRDDKGQLVGNIEDPDDPEGEGPPARLYYDDDYNLIGTSKPIPGVEVSTPTPKPAPTPTPTPTPKPGPTPTPTPTPKPGPTPTPSPAPAPMPKPGPTPAPLGPELKFGSPEDTINRSRSRSATTVPLTPTPAPTAPTGPDRSELPDLYRPDMSGAPDPTEPPKNQSWFGKGLDYLDKGVKKVGGALSNFGHQFTTDVTKEKLKMNWHQAGKPSDSDQLAAWLVKQGVPQPVVTTVYDKMGIPYTAPATEPTAEPTADIAAEPETKTGGAQRLMPFNNINPKTGQRWTVDDLEARRAERNAQAMAATDTSATDTTPAPTPGKLPQPTTVGQPMNVTYGKGFEKFTKPKAATQFPSFGMGGQAPAYKTSTTVTPTANTTVPTVNPAVKPTTASLPAGGGAGVKAAGMNEPIKIGGQTLNPKNPADKKIIDKVQAQTAKVAEALRKPVAEMLTMVETKEDVAKIKQFVDQTFVKYGPMSESAFAVRNRLIEHVTQVGAQRRREHVRKNS